MAGSARRPTPELTPASAESAVLELTLRGPLDGAHTYRGELRLFRGQALVDDVSLGGAEVVLDHAEFLGLGQDITAHGELLRERLFTNRQLREAWQRACDLVGQGTLRVRVYPLDAAQDLHAFPWESLLESRGGISLGLSPDRSCARKIDDRDARAFSAAERPARMRLVTVIADPDLRGDYERNPLQAQTFADAIGALAEPGAVDLRLLGRNVAGSVGLATRDALRSQCERADILCIICHGAFDGDETALHLEQPDGTLDRLLGRELVGLLDVQRAPLLVVLAVCQSGGGPYRNDVLTAVGPQLAKHGVGAVVCMLGAVSVARMQRFVPELLGAVLADLPVDLAVQQARRRLDPVVVGAASDDWWRPALFLRPRDGRLWSSATASSHEAAGQRAAALRDHLDKCRATYGTGRANGERSLVEVFVDLPLVKSGPALQREALGDGLVLQALKDQRWLVLAGDGGSGKTACVEYVAYWLSRRRLAEPGSPEEEAAVRKLGPLGSPELSRLVPAPIDLARLERQIRGKTPAQIAGALSDVLLSSIKAATSDEQIDALREVARREGLLFIFEDLENVTPAGQTQLVHLLQALPGRLSACRALATIQQGDPIVEQISRSTSWAFEEIAPLDRDMRRRLAGRWFQEQELRATRSGTAGTRSLDEIERRHRRLEADQGQDLDAFGLGQSFQAFICLLAVYDSEPSVLRAKTDMSAVLDQVVGRLVQVADQPKKRGWWEKHPADLRALLAQVADRLLWDADGGESTISGDDLERIGRKLLTARADGSPGGQEDQRAALPRALTQGSTVFRLSERPAERGRVTKHYSFRLSVLRDLLAAEALCDSLLPLEGDRDGAHDTVSRGLRRAEAGAHWHRTLLFAAGRLALLDRSREVVYLARELVGRARGRDDALLLVLARDLLAEIGAPRGGDGDRRGALWGATERGLYQRLVGSPQACRGLPPALRVQAGALLAQHRPGDQRPGVLGVTPAWSEPLPGGDYELWPGQPRVDVGAFQIARYPITVHQFEQFRTSHEARRDGELWAFPPYPDIRQVEGSLAYLPDPDPASSAPNQPINYVTWYVAVAYCRWLTRRARREGVIGQDQRIRLPTEAEWVVAALVSPGDRTWSPWSAERQRCLRELLESPLRRPFAVGMFPELDLGAGVYDTLGHSYEWCASQFGGDPARPCEMLRPEADRPTIRGGRDRALLDRPLAARLALPPGASDLELSFRVVLVREGRGGAGEGLP